MADNKTKAVVKKTDDKALTFGSEQIDLIKSQIAVGATDDELKLFMYQAQRTGLDPMARQIYFIKRKVWNKETRQYDQKATIQTSIDGFRVVAERSGVYAGQDEPTFEEVNSKLFKCTVTVYKFDKKGVRYPAATGVAYWDEFAQTDQTGNATGMWKKMPHTMLSKVAEAIALRKAFPQDLSGLYTTEEMQQTENIDPSEKSEGSSVENAPAPATKLIEEKITPNQITIITQLVQKHREDGSNYATLEEFEKATSDAMGREFKIANLSKVQGMKLIEKLTKRSAEINAQRKDAEVQAENDARASVEEGPTVEELDAMFGPITGGK